MAGQLFAGLFTTQPNRMLPSGREPTDPAYSRQPVEFGEDRNTNALRFPPSTFGIRVVGVGIFDAATGGRLVSWMYLDAAHDLWPGDVCLFRPGDVFPFPPEWLGQT